MTKADQPSSLEFLKDESRDHLLFIFSSERVWEWQREAAK
jgi:hypothetical protein